MWFFSKKPVKMSTDEVNWVAAEIEKEFLETQRRKEQERLEKERLERERQERERLERERREKERKAREALVNQSRTEKEKVIKPPHSSGRFSLDVDLSSDKKEDNGPHSSAMYSLLWDSPEAAVKELSSRFVKKTDPTFVDQVTRIMGRKGLINKDIYSAAQMDRKLFSKVMSDRNYKPAKDTCVAIMMALKVDKDEAKSMLQSAGYALSDSNKRDAVFNYFFSHAHYNIFDMNEVLDQLNEKPLGECRF